MPRHSPAASVHVSTRGRVAPVGPRWPAYGTRAGTGMSSLLALGCRLGAGGATNWMAAHRLWHEHGHVRRQGLSAEGHELLSASGQEPGHHLHLHPQLLDRLLRSPVLLSLQLQVSLKRDNRGCSLGRRSRPIATAQTTRARRPWVKAAGSGVGKLRTCLTSLSSETSSSGSSAR